VLSRRSMVRLGIGVATGFVLFYSWSAITQFPAPPLPSSAMATDPKPMDGLSSAAPSNSSLAVQRSERLGSNGLKDDQVHWIQRSALHQNPRTTAALPSALGSVIDVPPVLEAVDDSAPPIEIGASLDADDPDPVSMTPELSQLEEIGELIDADDSWWLEMINNEQSPVMTGPELDADAGNILDSDYVPVEIGPPLIADGFAH
jgi:hypothetical protein